MVEITYLVSANSRESSSHPQSLGLAELQVPKCTPWPPQVPSGDDGVTSVAEEI